MIILFWKVVFFTVHNQRRNEGLGGTGDEEFAY